MDVSEVMDWRTLPTSVEHDTDAQRTPDGTVFEMLFISSAEVPTTEPRLVP